MFISDANSRFFSPSALLYEMKVLQEILKNGYVSPAKGITRGLSEDMIQGYLAKLSEEGLVEGSCAGEETSYRLTAAGEQRLRILFVDYIQELVSLYGVASEVIRKRLAEYYLQGVRTVAFYPVGETAEVAYLAIRDSGLRLSIAIDDDSMRWDTAFHEVTIHPPNVLATASVDAVIVTTCVFQSEILRNIQAIGRPELRILSI